MVLGVFLQIPIAICWARLGGEKVKKRVRSQTHTHIHTHTPSKQILIIQGTHMYVPPVSRTPPGVYPKFYLLSCAVCWVAAYWPSVTIVPVLRCGTGFNSLARPGLNNTSHVFTKMICKVMSRQYFMYPTATPGLT